MTDKRSSRAIEVSSANSNTAGRPRPRILIADDDHTTGELAVTANTPYRIVSVTNGREAYRVLRHDSDFDVAVFNLTMPLLPGVDIVRYMKSERRLMRIPVIIVSGDQGITNVSDSFAAGAIAFLAKPFAAEQLHRAITLAMCSVRSENAARAA